MQTNTANAATMPKRGRPRSITPQIAELICNRVANGDTIHNICLNAGKNGIPYQSTVYEEVERNPEFAEMLTRARKLGAHALAESVKQLADEAVEKLDPARTQLLINQCRMRQWLAGKYNEIYADKPTAAVNIDLTMGKVLAETLEPPTIEHDKLAADDGQEDG